MIDPKSAPAPLRALVGWSEAISQKDATDLAKGFVVRRFDAVDASWYAVAPFMGGFFWETHEGGPGKGYLAQIVETLAQDPGAQPWFPSGDRAFQLMMRDGKPFGVLLSKEDSRTLIGSGVPPLKPSTKMTRAVTKGTAMLAFGGTMAGLGAASLVGSLVFFALAANPGPQQRPVKFENLPHAQWSMVEGTAVTEIVSKLEFNDGTWSTDRRSHMVQGVNAGEPGIGPMPEDEALGVDMTDPAAAPDAAVPVTSPDYDPASPVVDEVTLSPDGSFAPSSVEAAQAGIVEGQPATAVDPEVYGPVYAPPVDEALAQGADASDPNAEPLDGADSSDDAPADGDVTIDGRSSRVTVEEFGETEGATAGPVPVPRPLPWSEDQQ